MEAKTNYKIIAAFTTLNGPLSRFDLKGIWTLEKKIEKGSEYKNLRNSGWEVANNDIYRFFTKVKGFPHGELTRRIDVTEQDLIHFQKL